MYIEFCFRAKMRINQLTVVLKIKVTDVLSTTVGFGYKEAVSGITSFHEINSK